MGRRRAMQALGFVKFEKSLTGLTSLSRMGKMTNRWGLDTKSGSGSSSPRSSINLWSVLVIAVSTESGVDGDGATGKESEAQVSSSDKMEEFASLAFLGVTNEGDGLSATTSSVDKALNSCSRAVVEIGMVYGMLV